MLRGIGHACAMASAATARTNLGLGTAATVADSTLVHLAGAETITGAKTFNAGAFIDKGSQVFDIRAYGAVIDGIKVTDAAMMASSSTPAAA